MFHLTFSIHSGGELQHGKCPPFPRSTFLIELAYPSAMPETDRVFHLGESANSTIRPREKGPSSSAMSNATIRFLDVLNVRETMSQKLS